MNVTPFLMKVCMLSPLPTVMSSPGDRMHCLEPRASLWLGMPHSSHLSPQSSLLCTSSSGSEATGTASVLTAWYLLSVPTDVPSDNASEVGWEVNIPGTVQVKRGSSIIIRCKELWVLLPLISDYCLFYMDHQNTLKYLAFTEIICCQSFSFEECFPYIIKPHPISYLLKLSKQQRERTRKEIKQKRERRGIDGGRK